MIFDTHAHYDDEVFDADRASIMRCLCENKIGAVVNVGASMKSTRATMELIERYDMIYGAVGVHPSEVYELTEADMELLKTYSKHPKVCAIGEIGLDYHYEDTNKELQKQWFIRQLDLAREVKLPVIIHSRDAAKDTMDILQQEHAEHIGGIIHCYSYSKEQAKEYLELGFYFGIGGVITFKNGKKLKETVEMLPMDKIVLETDCPYLSPEPHRGTRNSSLHLPYVVQAIADIKGITRKEVRDITWENACRVYGLSIAKEDC